MEAGASTRRACCYTNDAKMVAASGIAPDSPRLQRGANLSQPFDALRLLMACGCVPTIGDLNLRLGSDLAISAADGHQQ